MIPPKGKGAWMATVGEKGQIVIPKPARDMFGITPGDSLLILGDEERGLAILSGDKMATLVAHIFGAAPFPDMGGGKPGAPGGPPSAQAPAAGGGENNTAGESGKAARPDENNKPDENDNTSENHINNANKGGTQ